ncbi:DUF805 domain-containing protein [Roseibium sediminicola]|uniref:DUF805 domain-containing protein n=1 Tax=Roseibium sediminicola TaxID=2933272 RepID=A0ABT0GX80_9HYPH|nr:DUF805 domain-containing protein [Roseibium sp. CAU 1639]MCK7614044.1 DUF805 domain-containing protein [Roseibium sp. CAU 1639]
MSTPPQNANVAPGPVWALFSPIGRISREPYWLCFLVIWLVFGIAIRIWWLSAADTPTPESLMAGEYIATNPLFPVLFFVLQWFELALVIKRLQDIGQSGFLALLIFVPFLNLIMLIVLGIIPSQADANRHGPMPNSYWRKR